MDAATLSMLPPNVLAAYLRDPRQQLYSQMVEQGTDTSPVQSPWQGLARMVKAGIGAWQGGKLQDQYSKQAQDQADERRAAMAVALGRPAETEKLQNGGSINWNAQAPNYAAASGMLGSGNQELQDKLMQAQLAQNAQNAGFEQQKAMQQAGFGQQMAMQNAAQQFQEAQQARMLAAENARQQAGFNQQRSLADLAQQNALQMKNFEYQNDPSKLQAEMLAKYMGGMAQGSGTPQLADGQTINPMGVLAAEKFGLKDMQILPNGQVAPLPAGMGKMTDEQAKAAGFADRMAAASPIITNTASAATNPWQHARDSVPFVGNYLTSPEYQQSSQAQRDFINAQLRRESGAAIAATEFDNGRRQYFPQPGDSPEVLAQKAANRDLAIKAMGRSAGNSYKLPTNQAPVTQNPAITKLKSAGYTDEQIAEYMRARGMQ